MIQGKKISSDFWNKTFLEELKKSMGNVLMTCRTLGISPPSYYNQRLNNPAFARKATEIIDIICVPVLEDIAFTRAVKGDNRLLMFLLRSRGGKRWNQDLVEAALAKYMARKEEERDYKKEVLDQQRVPTERDMKLARAIEKVIMEEEDEEEDDGNAATS